MLSILSSVVSTVVGGVILAVLFFLVREKVFPIPDHSGRWTVISKTEETNYKPFAGMQLRYTVILRCEGSNIYGTSEKTFEQSSQGPRTYVGDDRVRGEITGVIEKRYFSKDKTKLHVVEHGEKRESTIYYDLTVEERNLMTGKFFSTAADSKGKVEWKRD